MHNLQKIKAFTLVELSIVIVIIGLIIGGVVAGSALVNQAKLRSVLTDISKIRASVSTYRLQYDALPGDHQKAYDYFGNNCDATASKCNGDGNRQIAFSGVADDNEMIRFWQHLSLSQLFPGSFTGVSVAGGDGNVTKGGINQPASAFGNNSSYSIFNYPADGAWTGQVIKPGNIIVLGQDQAATWSWIRVMPVADSYNIDSKYDDGKPYIGRILSLHNSSCANSASGAAAIYQIDTNNLCAMGFYLE